MNSKMSSTDIPEGLESILEHNCNQASIITNNNDIINEEKYLLSNQDNLSINRIDNGPMETSISSSSKIGKKQESLISVYDNSNDGEQTQQQQQQQQSSANSFPLVGIFGRSSRSQAFTKRLLLSGFPKPILYDQYSTETDSNNLFNYVSYETFCHYSPSIILITDHLSMNFESFIAQNKQQLIIDARELITKYFSKNNTSHLLKPISKSYRAFGNISNWEIENGTQRTGVAVEQGSPLNLIKFIYDLNCFTRGISYLDSYSYDKERIKSFRNCLFPFVSTIIIFSLCFLLSIFQHMINNNYSKLIYYQASSITASTSLTLISLLFLIRPIAEIIGFISKTQHKQNVVTHSMFIQRWLQSKQHLTWFALSFAFLHLIFLLFSKNDFNQKLFFYPACFGLFTLIFLCILSFVYFPWISERLLWHEYHLLTSYLGPFCLLIAFIHVFIVWKYNYYYKNDKNLFNLKFLSMILPCMVLLLRMILYGVIGPTNRLFKWIENRQNKTKASAILTKDTSILP